MPVHPLGVSMAKGAADTLVNTIRAAMPPLSQFKRFDIRKMIRGGIEPFLEIRRRVDAVPIDKGLLLIAPFLPSPLIEILNGEGFSAKVERGTGRWMIYFWREND